MRRLMLVLLLALAVPASLQAYTFHVQAGDAIQDSIDAASVGDSVLVGPGIYHESIDLKWGVTVCSTDGSPHTRIMAPDSVYVVSLTPAGWPRPGFRFGGPNAGFTVLGGTNRAVHLAGTWEPVYVEDMTIRSVDANKALFIESCDSLHVSEVEIDGYTYYGVYSYLSVYEMESVWIREGSAEGIYLDWGDPGLRRPVVLRDVVAESQQYSGIVVRGADVVIDGGQILDCPVGVSVSDYMGAPADSVRISNVTFSGCASGVAACALWGISPSLDIEGCEFQQCSIGLELTNASGSVAEGTTFWEIYDTGVSATSYSDVEVKGTTFEDVYNTSVRIESHSHGIIGDLNHSNVFDNIDGIGVHLADTATAMINYNNFYGVLGTAIQCETGAGGTIIDNCVLDGSGGCFEGIHTSGLGTLAKVRNCEIVDYDTGGSRCPGRSTCSATRRGPLLTLGTTSRRTSGETATSRVRASMFTMPGWGLRGRSPISTLRETTGAALARGLQGHGRTMSSGSPRSGDRPVRLRRLEVILLCLRQLP